VARKRPRAAGDAKSLTFVDGAAITEAIMLTTVVSAINSSCVPGARVLASNASVASSFGDASAQPAVIESSGSSYTSNRSFKQPTLLQVFPRLSATRAAASLKLGQGAFVVVNWHRTAREHAGRALLH